MGGWRYLGRKTLQALFTLWFIITVNFFLFRIMPSDPVRLLTRQRGIQLSPEAQQAKIEELGLHLPLPTQYVRYLGDTLRLDFGDSFIYPGVSVSEVFLRDMWRTLLLVGIATFLMIVIGVYLGIRGGWKRDRPMDRASMGFSLTFYATPDFWLGMVLLIIFSTQLGWFPSGGFETPDSGLTGLSRLQDIANHLFLPVLTLTLGYIGEFYLLMRSSLLDVLGEEYITTVRAKGVREDRVLWRHAVRNALLPTVSAIALSFGFLIGGSLTVELVFSYPGVGLLTIEALDSQDFRLLQGLFLFFSLAVLVANFAADLLYGVIDPRVREA